MADRYPGCPTIQATVTALEGRIDFYWSMDRDPFARAAHAIASEHHGISDDAFIVEALRSLFEQGSIDAGAALWRLSTETPEQRRWEQSLIRFLRRNPALGEELQVEGLRVMLEEELDKEVAAGRLQVEVDERTGEKRYRNA